jgi:hypothetical protein
VRGAPSPLIFRLQARVLQCGTGQLVHLMCAIVVYRMLRLQCTRFLQAVTFTLLIESIRTPAEAMSCTECSGCSARTRPSSFDTVTVCAWSEVMPDKMYTVQLQCMHASCSGHNDTAIADDVPRSAGMSYAPAAVHARVLQFALTLLL